jgi:hypothetical protein
MKTIVIFLSLVLAFSNSFAQTVLKKGSNGYVTIDGNDYARGYITYRWYKSGTDTLIELARQYNTSQPFRPGKVCTSYKDGDNGSASFTSFAALQSWLRANLEPLAVYAGTASLTPNGTSVFTITVPAGYVYATASLKNALPATVNGSANIITGVSLSGTTLSIAISKLDGNSFSGSGFAAPDTDPFATIVVNYILSQ